MPKYAEEILAAVTELQQHPSAEQVFLEMKREHPSIAPDRYDRTERHDHMICSRCGKIEDIRLPGAGKRQSYGGEVS